MKILVTGATGYIGGRLVSDLLEKGFGIRVLVRDTSRIIGRDWANQVEVFKGDLLKRETLDGLCDGIDAAYYLVHSMSAGSDYPKQDKRAAKNFIDVSRKLSHVIYLGGLLPKSKKASAHLRSRAEVGRLLRKNLPTTEFRAGPIIGSGSASFEMVRYLTERIPIMITPRWIKNKVQPIAVRDILSYLILALEKEPSGIVEVGAEAVTFGEMMEQFAELRGLKRTIIPSPFLAPKLAARWVGLVTPLSNNIAVPLVKSVVTSVLADLTKAKKIFPEVEPIPYKSAVRFALKKVRLGQVETRWSGSLGARSTYRLTDSEGMVREVRTLQTSMKPEDVAKGFMTIGGDRGWLVWQWLWDIRGLMDILIGGPGLRRGRRDPNHLLAGEALDFWRVEEVDPPNILRLRAEMRVPGRAWLQWETKRVDGKTVLVQTAIFAPKGLLGVLYWYSLYIVHKFIFSDLIRAVHLNAKTIKKQQSTSLAWRSSN